MTSVNIKTFPLTPAIHLVYSCGHLPTVNQYNKTLLLQRYHAMRPV